MWWGDGEYELVAERFGAIHDRLVEKLAPRPGEQWLDVATGTGEVAARAARAGAEVTGVDLSPGMIEKARRRPEPVRWELGDAQELRYGEAAFDVVSSSFGLIFAPDPERVAAELRRVLRPGGRLGLTTWCRDADLEALWRPYEPGPPPDRQWQSEDEVLARLHGFELEVERGTWFVEGESPEALWEWFGRAVPPHREQLRRLEPDVADAFRRDWLAFYERHTGPGGVRHDRHFLLLTGIRR